MTELRCDFDSRSLPADWFLRVQALARHQRWRVSSIMLRKSRHGWHVVVACANRLTPVTVIAAQAILGSDWKREVFNLYRAERLGNLPATWRTSKRWNALYSTHTHLGES